MEIVDLALRSRRPLEERESYVAEGALPQLAASEILARHEAEVGALGAEGDAAPLIVSAHPPEVVGASDLPTKVKYVRWFHAGSGRLIVAAVLVEPRNRERICTPIGDVDRVEALDGTVARRR